MRDEMLGFLGIPPTPINSDMGLLEESPSMVDLLEPEGVSYSDPDDPNLLGIVVTEDGFDEEEARRVELNDLPFRTNLANHVPVGELNEIAQTIVDAVSHDLTARKEWEFLLARGIQELYIGESQPAEEFAGATTASFPLMLQSMVQFNARTMDELFPPQGPVKTAIVGKQTSEIKESSLRVETHMNYQITEESKGWYAEDDRMTWYLSNQGQAFKKVYHDPVRGRNTSKFIQAKDLVVPSDVTDLDSSPRITEIHTYSPAMIRTLVHQGLYVDLDLSEGSGGTIEGEIEDAIHESQGTSEDYADDESPRKIYETCVSLILEDFPENEGFPVPYKVYVDAETQQVLGLYRNWDPEGLTDDPYERDEEYVDYTFIPGFGFYGLGLTHLVGQLGHAVNELLQIFINGSMFASANGGFVSRDAFPKGASISMKPGVYEPTDKTVEELQKAFFTPNFKPPSNALGEALKMLIDTGKEFTATTEAMTGQAGSSGPVGTMVALIEQGSKVFSGIHKRMHAAKRREYTLLAKLNGRYLPSEGYPFRATDDADGDLEQQFVIYQQDYGPRIDILPVSDPNITSPQQRIALAEAVRSMAMEDPASFDLYEATRRLLEALRVSDIDGVLLPRGGTNKLYDPSIENSMLAMGRAPRIGDLQSHAAHIMVHEAFLKGPLVQEQMQMNPDMGQAMMMSIQGHILEHKLHLYRQEMSQQMGQLPPMDLAAAPTEEVSIQLPPEVEGQISEAMAQQAQQMMQEQEQNQQPPPPTPEEQAAQFKEQEFAKQEERKQQEWEAKMARDNQAFQQDLHQDDQKHAQDMSQAADAAGQKLMITGDAASQKINAAEGAFMQKFNAAEGAVLQKAGHAKAEDQAKVDAIMKAPVDLRPPAPKKPKGEVGK